MRIRNALAATLLVTIAGATSAVGSSQTACSKPHDGDKVVGKAYIDRGSHKVGGEGTAIDSKKAVGKDYIKCSVSSTFDADNVVDTYISGLVYEYNSGTYSQCFVRAGYWRGYWSTKNMKWSKDLDNVSGKCGWKTKPIKVRNTQKALWDDGTIKTVNTYATERKLD